MRATIWKVLKVSDNETRYRLQIDHIFGKREEGKVKKVFKDWNEAGYGYAKDRKETTLFFARSFKDKETMLEWAKSFPYELTELTARDNHKKIKTDHNSK